MVAAIEFLRFSALKTTARVTHYNRVNRNRDHKEAVENPLGRPMFATALPEAYSDIL